VRAQKQMKRMEDKTVVILENTCIIINRMLLETLMLKLPLVRFQKEMNLLLRIGGKVIEKLAELHSTIRWKNIIFK
jgi:hypothetical protein